MEVKDKIKMLKEKMRKRDIDAYIVPSTDPHMSEYLASHFMGLSWLSGFTGSSGTLVIAQDICGLWTDGRYFIQAEEQLRGTDIRLFKTGMEGVQSIEDWLKEHLFRGGVVGIDGRLFSLSYVRKMEKKFKTKGIKIAKDEDLLDDIWADRPQMPKTPIFLYDIAYAGKSTVQKLKKVRGKMIEMGADYYLIPSLDDIAWLYNIRGGDIDYNPVAMAYALISKEEAWLFIDKDKVPKDVSRSLKDMGIGIHPYEDVYRYLSNLNRKNAILLDPARTNNKLYESIGEGIKKIESISLATKLKAIKNEVEIKNLKNAHIKDGVAMVKFLHWLDRNITKANFTEITIADKLEEFRGQQQDFMDLSFPTIAGYKDHGAIIHYQATKESTYKLKAQGMVLIDSGAHYLDGTTDITRTIILGEITSQERKDYTLVLKGNINLAKAKFLKGTTGAGLDILARKPLWDRGIDYKHGTGHGIGHFLNVHEGPHSISQVASKVKLEEGMIITNEPGLYREGSHGIRIENELLVVKDTITEFGEFLGFEVITYCPIDTKGIDISLLSEDEKGWLNNYHKMVYETLIPFLDAKEGQWLKDRTRPI